MLLGCYPPNRCENPDKSIKWPQVKKFLKIMKSKELKHLHLILMSHISKQLRLSGKKLNKIEFKERLSEK